MATHVRISDEAHAQLRALAAAEKRSLVTILDLALAAYAQKSPATVQTSEANEEIA